MTGVVLCGGQSTRMGSDKGLLLYQLVALAERAAQKLASLQLPVVLSVNKQQRHSYQIAFPDYSFVEDDDCFDIGGPLKGILSVHRRFPSDDLLVLACDMPLMQIEVLQYLKSVQDAVDVEARVFRKEKQIEPLCGLYKTSGLQKLYQLYEQGSLKRFSMQNALEQINTSYLPVLPEWEKSFDNYNTPADLNER